MKKKLSLNELEIVSFVTGAEGIRAGGNTNGKNCGSADCTASNEEPCYETDICYTQDGCETELCIPG